MPLKLDRLADTFFRREILGLRAGAVAPLRAVGYLLRNPLWIGACVLPWAVSLILVLPASIYLGFQLSHLLVDKLLPEMGFALSTLSEGIVRVLTLPLSLALTILVFLIATTLVLGPIHDALGERIERTRLASRPDLLWQPMPRRQWLYYSIRESVFRALLGLPPLALSLLVALIPIVGPPMALVMQGLTGAFLLTLDAFGMPMNRRGMGMGQKLRWVWRNRGFALGFGLPLLVLPCAFFLLPPLSAVAGALVYSEFLLAENSPDP